MFIHILVIFLYLFHFLTGQLREVTVYRLICHDTVEEKLLALQDKKRQLSQQTIGMNGNKVEIKLTLEDLKALFV